MRRNWPPKGPGGAEGRGDWPLGRGPEGQCAVFKNNGFQYTNLKRFLKPSCVCLFEFLFIILKTALRLKRDKKPTEFNQPDGDGDDAAVSHNRKFNSRTRRNDPTQPLPDRDGSIYSERDETIPLRKGQSEKSIYVHIVPHKCIKWIKKTNSLTFYPSRSNIKATTTYNAWQNTLTTPGKKRSGQNYAQETFSKLSLPNSRTSYHKPPSYKQSLSHSST